MSPYRSPIAPTRRAPPTPLLRLIVAFFCGTLAMVAARRRRNAILADPDGALRQAKSLAEVFEIAKVLNLRGIFPRPCRVCSAGAGEGCDGGLHG